MYILCDFLCLYTHECRDRHKPNKGIGPSGPGVIDRYEPCHMGSGNKIQSPARIAGTLNH